MKLRVCLLLPVLFCLTLTTIHAQSLQDPLLDKLVGKWVMKGTIEGKPTTHDVVAEWVLNRQYIRIHEVSREKNEQGQPQYEAIVFIGWDKQLSQYSILWLDTTGGGGLTATGFGHAPRGDSDLKFIFTASEKTQFHTTFAYDAATKSWQWIMDLEDDGKLQPFARLKLERA